MSNTKLIGMLIKIITFFKYSIIFIFSCLTILIGFVYFLISLLAPIVTKISGYLSKKFPRLYKPWIISTVFLLVFSAGILLLPNRDNVATANNSNQSESSMDSSKNDENLSKQKEIEEKKQKEIEEKKQKEIEEQLKIAEEQRKQEENNLLIEQAISIDETYNQETPDIGNQDINEAIENNKNIALLGSSTRDKKLFDVNNIVDGDTIKISELGTIRLIGIDTPETKDPRYSVQCFGEEATNRARELLENKKVYLEFDPANRIDKYGRTLAYVFREDGYFYNLEMIKDGYAFSYKSFPHPRLDEFNIVEETARINKSGLFSPDTCNGEKKDKVIPLPPVEKKPEVIVTPPSNKTTAPKTDVINNTETTTPPATNTPPVTKTTKYNHSKDNYKCSDFKTWEEANDVFQESLLVTRKDIHKLDGNTEEPEDGIPCESLLKKSR